MRARSDSKPGMSANSRILCTPEPIQIPRLVETVPFDLKGRPMREPMFRSESAPVSPTLRSPSPQVIHLSGKFRMTRSTSMSVARNSAPTAGTSPRSPCADSASSSLESALPSRSTGDIGAWRSFAAVNRSAYHQVSAPQFASAHAVLSGAHDGVHLITADTVSTVELHWAKTFATRISEESVSTPQGNSVRLTFAEERAHKIKRC
eukprot:1005228_1